MNELVRSIKVFIIFSLLLGIVYPLCITLLAQVLFPYRANGSLIYKNNAVVGSELIGQKFDKPEYFNSRPSAVDYNAQGSGGSNYGPTNSKFINNIKDLALKVRTENSLNTNAQIPADMVLASGSGLDPHITVDNAKLQIKRIAAIRNIPDKVLENLVEQSIDHDFIGLWGERGVNILHLNLALNKISQHQI